ncbi:MAG: tryptophan synthase subunit alpha [Anaerolineaceae bacterium]
MNRVDTMFRRLKERNEGALMCYLPESGSNFRYSMEIIDAFVEGGVDMIELCIPGGAPWLDGAPMQTHHKNDFDFGINAERAFELAALVRSRYPELPILPMGYVSAIVQMGVDRFVSLAKAADIDGFELPDYPSIKADDPLKFHQKMREKNMWNVNFIDGICLSREGSPEFELLTAILTDARGFLFMTATAGVTGGTGDVALEHLTNSVARVRDVQTVIKNECPVLVGFGLTTPTHVRQVISIVKADAVVVGSAVSRLINKITAPDEIMKFIKELKGSTLRS